MARASTTVSTSQLISQVANRFDVLPKKITKEVIQTFLETVENAVIGGGKVRVDGIGIIQVKDRKARIGRNPQTGEKIKIAASKKIAFRAAKALKERLGGTRKTAKKKK